MTLKKILSVFLAVVMLVCVSYTGLVGIAASIDYSAQYGYLANALKNDYVRELTNYTITNNTLDNGSDGFDADANGFSYEHRVTAKDNAAGDILKAANIFYYITENLMSTTYGSGCYDADKIFNTVTANIKEYFGGSTEDYYEDFYGDRYYPTDEEIEKYNDAVELIEASDRSVSQATLTALNIYFMKQDYYTFYNVETILKYFLGNTTKINAGNWYHRFSFVVQTSVDTCLEACDGINNIPDTKLEIRTAVYEFDYERTYDDTGTKAYYAFKKPSVTTVWENYASEFGFTSKTSVRLDGSKTGLTRTGQASSFYIAVSEDTTTIPYLRSIYALFSPYIEDEYDEETGATWDKQFSTMTDSQLQTAVPNSSEIVASMEYLTATYSNDALLAMFGDNIGNMVTLTYILKSISETPVRTVRGTATFEGTADKLNKIVRDVDALIYNDPDGEGESADTARRVGIILKQFFNTNSSLFEGTSAEGQEFTNVKELVHHVVTGLLFNNKIINTLVGLLYPLVVNLLEENVYDKVTDAVGDSISGLAEKLINNILEQNELAIHPNTLAERINSDYPGQYTAACSVLSAAGDKWDNVNFDALDWGVDSADYDKKAEVFTDALCASLGGFIRLVVTVFAGDADYTDNAGLSYDDDQFNEYFDKYLINILGVSGWLRSQGGYTKLIIPLLRVLGLTEQDSYDPDVGCYGYVSSKVYNYMISTKTGDNYNYGYSLRLIVEPIVYWVEEVLAARPFETLWCLVPNLVYFFTRQGNTNGYEQTWEEYKDDWSDSEVSDRTHGPFEVAQRYSLLDILDAINIDITINVPILANKKWNISVGSLKSLINQDEMLGSVNGLLNELLSLDYTVGPTGTLLTVAYANEDGDVVMPGSFEYATNSASYPIELTTVYANDDETEYVMYQDETHTKEITNPEMYTESYKIPQLQEAKLTSVTTEVNGELVDKNAIGVLNADWNTIDVKNPGVVLLYVLRFVISALGYKYDVSIEFEDETYDFETGESTVTKTALPFLIECFGLDLESELFQGLSLGDIIYNVMLHPDEAICALLELFYSNEEGYYYATNKGSFTRVAYTYPLTDINYHNDVLLNKTINPSLSYGTQVRYSQYWTQEYANATLEDLDDLVANILTMLDVGDFSDGFGPFLKNMLDESVFNNDLMNTLFNVIYQLLGGLNDSIGFDIETILDAALDVTYDTYSVGKTIEAMLGYETPASRLIKNATTWADIFNQPVVDEETGEPVLDEETGEQKIEMQDVELDWGIQDAEAHGLTTHDAFLRIASALLSPAAFAIRFLFMDEHLDILGLIELDSYAGYQYAIIGLLEALSCPNILTYKEYWTKGQQEVAGTKVGDANTIYYLLSPVLGLLDKVYEDPLTTALELIPNLLFFISIGGLNDLLNNLVHFAYVLLDILKPILNGYDLLNGLISNITIGDMTLNLTLPLDLDFNGLISDLVGTLVGDSLEILGVKITLPYIDFHTLCCGTLTKYNSKESRTTIRLDATGGGDLITAIIRLAFEIIFMEENKQAIAQIIRNAIGVDETTGELKLDDFDGQTLYSIVDLLFGLLETYEVPDMLLFAVYFLVTKLTPISTTLQQKLTAKNMTINDLIDSFDINDLSGFVTTLTELLSDDDSGSGSGSGSGTGTGTGEGGSGTGEGGSGTGEGTGESGGGSSSTEDGEGTPTQKSALSLLDRIKALFEKIKAFFKAMFS